MLILAGSTLMRTEVIFLSLSVLSDTYFNSERQFSFNNTTVNLIGANYMRYEKY